MSYMTDEEVDEMNELRNINTNAYWNKKALTELEGRFDEKVANYVIELLPKAPQSLLDVGCYYYRFSFSSAVRAPSDHRALPAVTD